MLAVLAEDKDMAVERINLRILLEAEQPGRIDHDDSLAAQGLR